jgi:ribonuclease BN (tRNA processing enzyme)
MTSEAWLTVLGSGTLLPSAQRGSAGFHLAVSGSPAGPPCSVLLDCGSGTLHSLASRGVDWAELDVLAVTHHHPDHVADLVPLLAAFRYSGRTRPLELLGPPDLGHFLEGLSGAYGPWVLDPGFELQIVTPGASGGRVGPTGEHMLAGCPTPHTRGSLALRLSGPWGTVGYTGDTGPSSELGPFLAGSSVLIAECALGDPPEMDGHLSPSSLAALANGCLPDLLLVTHVYPPRTPEEVVEATRHGYDGAVEAAFDGMRVRITSSGADVDRSTRPG